MKIGDLTTDQHQIRCLCLEYKFLWRYSISIFFLDDFLKFKSRILASELEIQIEPDPTSQTFTINWFPSLPILGSQFLYLRTISLGLTNNNWWQTFCYKQSQSCWNINYPKLYWNINSIGKALKRHRFKLEKKFWSDLLGLAASLSFLRACQLCCSSEFNVL